MSNSRFIPFLGIFTAVQAAFAMLFIAPGWALPASSAASIELPQQRAQALRSAPSAVLVTFVRSSGQLPQPSPWLLRLSDHREWLTRRSRDGVLHEDIDERMIALSLKNILPADVPLAHDGVALPTDSQWRMAVSTAPAAGWSIDDVQAADLIAQALRHRLQTVAIPLVYATGKLLVVTDHGIDRLTILSEGKSNFSDSPAGRSANVRKALNDQLNGFVMLQGKTFSFNSTLLGSHGWFDSYVIVNGHDLRKEPGGGICQAATTLYRAAVLAGLPVPTRANHSLYVSHYRDYGVGIDATVYAAGGQDLKVVNDTPHDILILARNNGDDAFVDFYGIPDGRSVTLQGPYFAKSEPASVTFQNRSLFLNEIGWKQQITFADGHVQKSDIISRYEALPRKLYADYMIPRGSAELQTLPTAAGSGAEVAMR